MDKSICIVNYGMGNLRSVEKKVIMCGVKAVISDDPERISQAERLIIPGVGNFEKGMNNIREKNIIDALNYAVLEKKVPVLGICLGMQLMCKSSEEGRVSGLGWIDADVVRFRIDNKIRNKVPHMGWNNVDPQKESIIMKGLSKEALYYFVHSYHINCNDKNDVVGVTNYELDFVSVFQRGNIFGTQFHPEKSHDQGSQLLKNFIEA